MIDYDNILFNINISSEMPHPGAMLVAEPFLRDEHFAHAVICLVEYGKDSTSMGVVMNHPTAYTLQGLVEGVTRKEEVRYHRRVATHIGRPVYWRRSSGDARLCQFRI